MQSVRYMVLVFFATAACHGGTKPAQPAAAQQAVRQPLSVAMFPWIPDSNGDNFEKLWKHYEERFEHSHPNIDVSVGTVADGDYYDAKTVAGWMTSGDYDVVEIDLVLLGDLIAQGAIQPFWVPEIENRFISAAREAAQLDNAYWGVPHLMCTYFLFSRNAAVASAQNYAELEKALKALPDSQQFSGNLTGSWDATALYVESFYQQEKGAPTDAVAHPVQPQVLGNLHMLADDCAVGDKNPCTDGTYGKQWNQAALDFAAAKAQTTFGYSERLWVVLTAKSPVDPQSIRASALPMGKADKQLLFTDAFVVSKSCTGTCLRAAMEWVEYATSQDALGYMLASSDAGPDAVPRYLLPANLEALSYGKLAEDMYYPMFRDALDNVAPLPSRGVPEYRERNKDEIISIIRD